MNDLSKDTLLFAEERSRMCKSYESCRECPLDETKCAIADILNSAEDDEKILQTVQNWHDNKPLRTYKEDFFEKFPNAERSDSGEPIVCKALIYRYDKDCSNMTCDECWNEPMEE